MTWASTSTSTSSCSATATTSATPCCGRRCAAGGDGLHPDHVLVTAGAAAALFCTATTLLDPGDHAVVVRTNYATNLETPRAIGADLDVVDLSFDDGWALDVERVAERGSGRPDAPHQRHAAPQPHRHDVRGLDLDALVELAERSGAVLLVDETYRDLTHGDPLPLAATRSASVISVSSMSKAYGLPGLRIGWAVCRDAELSRAAPGRQGAGADLRGHARRAHRGDGARRPLDGAPADPRRRARARLAIVREWMAGQATFEWVEPVGGVVGLVRARPEVSLDTNRFYEVLLAEHGTYVGPGHWFELDDRHFRLGYGWPTQSELRAGLAALTAAA